MTRKAFDRYRSVPHIGDSLIIRSKKGVEKTLPPQKWFVNKYTPVGEEADYYERKPYGGKRLLQNSEIVAFLQP